MLRKERPNGQKNQEYKNDATLKGLVRYIIVTNRRLILRAKTTGAWLNVQVTTVTGTVFTDKEFRNFLCVRYNVTPPNLQRNCDGGGTALNVSHTLSCSKGGLVIARHNEVRGELL